MSELSSYLRNRPFPGPTCPVLDGLMEYTCTSTMETIFHIYFIDLKKFEKISRTKKVWLVLKQF